MIRHPCIQSDGPHLPCKDCPIRLRAFCEDFKEILAKISENLDCRYADIPAEDRQDILALTTEGIMKGVGQFEGRGGAKFATWAWHIYRNKLSDHFRRKAPPIYGYFPSQQEQYAPFHETELKLAIAQCFETHLADDPTGCVRLWFDLYRYFQTGRTRRELAEAYHVKTNTLNQRIRRCRPLIAKLFRQCLEPLMP